MSFSLSCFLYVARGRLPILDNIMSSVKSLISKISKVLQDTGEPSLAKHQQSYMKNVVKFYGIRIPAAREKILDTFSKEIKALTGPQAIQVATGLVASEYSEDKVRRFSNLSIKFLSFRACYCHLTDFWDGVRRGALQSSRKISPS
jgi:hypothetical protein